MDHDSPHAPPVTPTLAMDRSRRAKFRIGRSLIPLTISSIVLCAIVVWHRDATHITKACARTQQAVIHINAYLDANGTLPLTYPTPTGLDAGSKTPKFKYADEAVIRWARTADQPVIVGVGPKEGLIVKPNGHPVAIYEDGRVHVEWMSGSDLGPALDEQARLAGTTR